MQRSIDIHLETLGTTAHISSGSCSLRVRLVDRQRRRARANRFIPQWFPVGHCHHSLLQIIPKCTDQHTAWVNDWETLSAGVG